MENNNLDLHPPQDKNAFYVLNENDKYTVTPLDHFTDISILTSDNFLYLIAILTGMFVLFSAFNWSFELTKIGDKK